MNEIAVNSAARRRFEQARRQARRDQLSARLTGRDNRMIPFDAIRSELRQQHPLYRGIQQIPVDSIVGSVGRYREFTRQFLPLDDSLLERWISVDKLALHSGWPPIDVYQVAQAYFVRDGNHRVSVARQLEMPTIEAHVWEFPEDIAIDPQDKLEDVLIRLGQRNFLEKTNLDGYYPEHAICFTLPGCYSELLAQIEDLHKTLAVIDGDEMPYTEAVVAWYEMIYLPTIQIIRHSTLLADFPGRSESDLFVWLSKHRDALKEIYGDYENLSDLVRLLAQNYREGSLHKMTRQVRRILGHEALPPLQEIESSDKAASEEE